MDKAEKRRRLGRLLALDGLVLLAVGVFVWLAGLGIGLPCLLQKYTGLLCPGCGNSRAAISLLKFDFMGAFAYNPLFLLEFGYIFWVYCVASRSYWKGGRFSYQPPWPVADAVVLVAVLAWGILRNLL